MKMSLYSGLGGYPIRGWIIYTLQAAMGKDIHYNIYTMSMYDKTNADKYIEFTTNMQQK
jgi:hypothetical protein